MRIFTLEAFLILISVTSRFTSAGMYSTMSVPKVHAASHQKKWESVWPRCFPALPTQRNPAARLSQNVVHIFFVQPSFDLCRNGDRPTWRTKDTFLVKFGTNETEIYQMSRHAYVKYTVKKITFFKWVRSALSGRPWKPQRRHEIKTPLQNARRCKHPSCAFHQVNGLSKNRLIWASPFTRFWGKSLETRRVFAKMVYETIHSWAKVSTKRMLHRLDIFRRKSWILESLPTTSLIFTNTRSQWSRRAMS